jgi:HK97 family phage portal protein
MANFLTRIFKGRQTEEKSFGSWYLPVTGGWLPPEAGNYWNWWQMGYDPAGSSSKSAIAEACVSAYAQTIAMCPGTHWRVQANGGRVRVDTSALSRILRRPNIYQSISDFLLNLTQSLYSYGNAYALARRNDRFEISELHLMDPVQCGARVAETGDVFYYLAGNEVIDRTLASAGLPYDFLHAVPARDVLHVRLKTRKGDPLKGESPVLSALIDEASSNAMAMQALAFYKNQSRPSGVLQTDMVLTKEQVNELRERWNQQSQGLNAGGVPILSAGLKWEPMTANARDSQLAELAGYTDKRIAAVYRVPLSILNLGGEGPQGGTEAMMQFWIATGLGFALNHIEEAFGRIFGLSGVPMEYLEFDTSALLRSAFKDRVEGFARGVQGGIFSPNDARAEFELPSAEFGSEPRVQQQVVPLSAAAAIPAAPPSPSPDSAPPADGPADSQEGDQKPSEDPAAKEEMENMLLISFRNGQRENGRTRV